MPRTFKTADVEELFHLAEVAEQAELPEGFRVDDEIKFRPVQLERLAQAKAALEARGSGPLPGGVGCLSREAPRARAQG
jgi:hypothetical protein